MALPRILGENIALRLILVWVGSLLLAYAGAVSTQFSFVQFAIVIGMLGSLGILTIQYYSQHSSRANEPSLQPVDTDVSDGDATDKTRKGTRVGATSGLTPEERRVQNQLIKTAFSSFRENPFTHIVSVQAPTLIQKVSEEMSDLDEETVEKVWRFTKDDGFFERKPGKKSYSMTPKAVDRAVELGEETLLDESVQDEILDVLLQSYRENPTYPRINRDELIEAVGYPEDEIDHNLWLLREKGYVETKTYLGVEAGYREVEITQLGRKVTQ